jgi:signal transduction histidine kinase/ligand-binding sensor domain-containing protein
MYRNLKLKYIVMSVSKNTFARITLLLFMMCLSMQVSELVAQTEVTFHQVFPPEGPYFRIINGVTQDRQGYMWFSSYIIGLTRYDGYNVKIFRHDPMDTGSLATNNVTCVFADRKGQIWTGTQLGLDRMDPVTGIFTHFRYKAGTLNSLSNDTVTAILEDHEGTLWVGTQNGLNRMDSKTGTFTRYQQNPTDPKTLCCNRVQVIYEDHQGIIWIGTANDQHGYNPNEQGGLNRLDRKTGKFTRYLHDPGDPHSLINDRIGAILEDSRGVFWVSTAGDGLHTMDRQKGIFERHTYDPAQPGKLSGPPPSKKDGLDLGNFFLTEDSSGAIWIASSKKWITRYDPKTKKLTHFDSFNGDDKQVRKITKSFCSGEGVLWLTTWDNSIYKVDPFEVRIPHVFTGSPVHAIHEDVSGALWLGTSGKGLIETERNNRKGNRIFTGLPAPYGLSDSFITSICEVEDSTLWIGSSKGLNHYNRKTKKFTRYVNDPKNSNSLANGFVNAIADNKHGSLWIATKNGLDRFDIKSGIFSHYINDPKDSTSLGGNNVFSLLIDHSGKLWAAAYGKLNLFDDQTGKFKRFPCIGGTGSLTEDADNIIWMGTTNGLYRSNAAVDTFLLLTDAEIGLTTTTTIACILEDNKKNLWVSSSAGILKIRPNRNDIIVYSRNQGVNASDLTISWGHNIHGEAGKLGEFFIGDKTGYYDFFPGQLKVNTTSPQIVITGFRLADNQLVLPGKTSPLNLPISYTKEIRLKHNQNIFSFDFTGIHYSSPEEIRILFFMENLEHTWRKAGREKNAFYYNVPPGRYIFLLKARNRDGVWGEKSIIVIIEKAWYKTWWAYLLYVLVLALIIWLFTWYRSRQLKAKNLLLEDKVKQRTKELEQSLSERFQLQKIVESQQALLNERLRISRELHDDIGSTLGSISIYSEVAKNRIEKNENTNEVLSKIGLASRELIDKMSDIVWSLNPNNEGFEQLHIRMLAFAAMMLAPRNIFYDFCVDEQLNKRQFTGEQLKNIFLIFKEALHNIVKYAQCKTVHLDISVKDNHVIMIIKDDGKGFDWAQALPGKMNIPGENLGGNGIKNMYSRAADLGGKLFIDAEINSGATIRLEFPL